MLKSFSTSKRPSMQDVQVPSVHNHKCYFHSSHYITKFCTNKKCTLPLCEKCIPIHIKQHIKDKDTLGQQNIISFQEAYKIATKNLQNSINVQIQNNLAVKQQLTIIKNKIQDIIKNQFGEIQVNILKRQNEAKILSQKYTKIKKGSLKTLIFCFSDQQSLKIKAQVSSKAFSKLTEIPLLIQELRKSLTKISQYQQKSTAEEVANSIKSIQSRDNLISKGNSSSSLILNSCNKEQIDVARKDQSKLDKQQKKGMKFESSGDFSAILKDQRSRLENVRKKNIIYATDYSSQKINQTNFQKYASKSVENFYLTKEKKSTDQNKGQKQNRPLQVSLRNYNSLLAKNHSPKKTQHNSTSEQNLEKIRKKYIGDLNAIKQNVKIFDQSFQKGFNSSANKNYVKNIPDKSMKTESLQKKNKELSNRILSRQEIRLNIQNRLNQKSISFIDSYKDKLEGFRSISNYFPKDQGQDQYSKQQTLRQPVVRQKRQQFTLNKNYQVAQQILRVDKSDEKIPMSSIKRELRVELLEDNQKQPAIKKFFDGNCPKLESFDVRDEKLSKTNNMLKIKHEITDFIVEKGDKENQQVGKSKIILRQITKNQPSNKDILYDEAKQSIKLWEPSLKKQELRQAKNYQGSQIRQVSESKNKEGRRFNYLYEMRQQSNYQSSKN